MIHKRFQIVTIAISVVGLAGCVGPGFDFSSLGQGKVNPFTTSDSALYTQQRAALSPSAATPESMIGPDGRCVSGPAVVATEPAAAPADGTVPAPRGVGLGMTECDVVNRLGPTEKVEIGATDGGQRSVVLTYVGGERPGIYRFTAGILTAIEKAPEPPAPVRPARPAKKPAKKTT